VIQKETFYYIVFVEMMGDFFVMKKKKGEMKL